MSGVEWEKGGNGKGTLKSDVGIVSEASQRTYCGVQALFCSQCTVVVFKSTCTQALSMGNNSVGWKGEAEAGTSPVPLGLCRAQWTGDIPQLGQQGLLTAVDAGGSGGRLEGREEKSHLSILRTLQPGLHKYW